MILDEPGYLRNLTILLPKTSNKTIANYMFWRAARASLGYFTEAARKIQLEYSKNITGTKSQVSVLTMLQIDKLASVTTFANSD